MATPTSPSKIATKEQQRLLAIANDPGATPAQLREVTDALVNFWDKWTDKSPLPIAWAKNPGVPFEMLEEVFAQRAVAYGPLQEVLIEAFFENEALPLWMMSGDTALVAIDRMVTLAMAQLAKIASEVFWLRYARSPQGVTSKQYSDFWRVMSELLFVCPDEGERSRGFEELVDLFHQKASGYKDRRLASYNILSRVLKAYVERGQVASGEFYSLERLSFVVEAWARLQQLSGFEGIAAPAFTRVV